jgi:pimeloyl-ACP methyl ester carboxylesterase
MHLVRTLCTALLCLLALPAAAQSETFRAGAMQVERHGDHGTPVVLLPGLATGGWVWRDTVAQLAGTHVVYVATLAGFDGQPAAGKNAFADAQAALDTLIAQRKLARPVLVGHSIGGTLALAYAAAHPGTLGGVVSIDGLAVFPGTENAPQAQRAEMGKAMQARVAGAAPADFAAQQLQYMTKVGVLDAARAAELAQRTAHSDPASVGQYVADVMALDLRQQLARIDVPVLVLSPYNEADFAPRGISAEAKNGYYRGLLPGIAKLDVVAIAPSRHFAMIDQPEQVRAALAAFLARTAGQ